jgi:amino acid adenylation domain-containing protein/non-ribosomal peptide synthase protein (TIGR01720 family)
VNRHPALRTNFVAPQGEPVQIVHEHREVRFEQFDASTWSEASLHEKLVEDAYGLFDLGRETLLRAGLYSIAPKDHVLLLTMHHIISDFWSLVLLMRELGALYEAERSDSTIHLSPLTHGYADYVSWQKEMLHSAEGERQWNYWREHLAGDLPVLTLPIDKPRPPVQTHRGASHLFRLDRELVNQLKALSRDCGVTLYMTLLATFQVLLARYSGQPEFIIGTPTSGRTRAEFSNVLGYFVNPISIRADLTAVQTFADLLQRVKLSALQAFKHQDYPLALLVKHIQPERDTSRSPLFQTMFVWQKAHLEDAQDLTGLALEDDTARISLGGLPVESFALRRRVAQFDLTLMMAEISEGIGASLEYMVDLFEEATIARMAGHFQNILRHVVSAPHQLVSDIPLLSAPELYQLLVERNHTSAPYPHQTCLHELFEAQVKQTPDSLALTFEDETLTYRELNARANQLAHHLHGLGAAPEQLIAILMERSSEMVVSLLAVLKAGAAYLPLDPAYPAQRLSYMLTDSGASILLTQEELIPRLPEHEAQVVVIEREWSEISKQSEENPPLTVTPDNLAYVIYTSGSTGQPKGVMITHRSLCNYTQFICKLLKLDELPTGEGASFATVSTITADLGNTAIFPSLLSGGHLHVLGHDVATDSNRLADYFARHRIDVLKIVPSHLNALLSSGLGAKLLPAKYLLLGGEAFPFELLERIRETGSPCEVFNHYGPTETTIGVLTFNLKQSGATGNFPATVPIGRPIDNTKIYIVDRNTRPVPVGIPGELCIGGAGVMRGYLNRPALTAERLSPNPFGDDPRGRLYHTGDLVRYLPDGNVEFLGRIDQQIKIRGFRIEPGEIEAALLRHGSVREAVITVREDAPGEKRLVAYVVAGEGYAPQYAELRAFLQRELPDYMVPSAIVSLRALPLTPNGKLDRRALPAPDSLAGETESGYVAPRNEAERQLAAIWRELLRVERVGIHDNFFELGGDSILSIQIVSKARQVGLRLSTKQLFQYHTIAELAEVANSAQAAVEEARVLTGSVPLTPIQQRFFQQDFAEPHHWNQSVLLETHQAVDSSILEKALAHLHLEHASLRLRFTHREEGWQQFVVAPGEPPPFTEYDLSHQSREAQQHRIEETAQELQASLNLTEGPISRTVYFNLGSAEPGRLLLIIHHLAVDAVSWRIIVEDLTTAYRQLADGREVNLPFRTASFKRWAERLTAYGRSSLVRDEAAYWLGETRRKVARLPLDKAGGSNTVSSAKTISMSLTVEETQALLQEVPHAFQTHLEEVLLAALGQTLARWTHAREILIDVEGHGREALFDDVDVSGTVGWFTSVYPVLLEMAGSDGEPWEILRSVKEQLRAVPQRGIGYGLLRYASGDSDIERKLRALPQAEIVFNYLGQLDRALPEGSFFKQAHESGGHTRSPRGRRPHLLEIIGYVRMDCLRLDWTYSESAHHRETVERLTDDFGETLRLFIEHGRSPQAGYLTPSDFPLVRLSDEQLSEVFQEVSFED